MKKLSAAALLAALALPGGAHAGASGGTGAKARKAPQGMHTAPAENPYFVADPDDARVLLPAPGFLERGFDRGYVEKMARPPLPAHVLDELEAATSSRGPVPVSLPAPGPSPYAATVVSGDVVVVEGNSSLVVSTQNGLGFNHNNGMFDVINEVLGRLGDNFDFITVWTTFPDPNVAAYYLPLRQDTRGLGECDLNRGRTFGCEFDQTGGLQLQGVVFMNSISTWQQWDRDFDGTQHPLDSFDSAIYSTLGQEVAHRWGSGLRFVDPRNGSVSNKLLGRDGSHWAAFVDTDASVMDGWDWAPPVDGRFDLVNDMDVFSTLDLYTMGALPVAAARPFFVIDNAVFDENDGLNIDGDRIPGDAVLAFGLPSVSLMEQLGIDLGARGEKVDLTIQDIVDAEGNRCPDPDHTQKSFRQAIVLVTRSGQTAAQAAADVEDLQVVADTWERWWSDRTGHALTLCTELDQECEHAEAALGGGAIESEAGDFIERGTTITITTLASAAGDDVKNARLVLTLDGNGADQAKLEESEIAIGDLAEGKEVEVPVEVSFDGDYNCASNTIVVAELVSDNAATVREEYRLFPGHATIFVETFGSDDDFEVNADGQDRATAGAMKRVNIELSCEMTKRTPERDMTPGSRGAYVTGARDELDGDTSLWSPEIDLSGTADPVLTFDFWLEGDEGDTMRVQLSADGEEFVDVLEEAEQIHGWGLGRLKIKDAFEGKLPEKVTARFLFAGKGRLEGAVDNVKVLDPEGQCRQLAQGFCGCTTDGGASPQASLVAVVGLLGLRTLRRRRRG